MHGLRNLLHFRSRFLSTPSAPHLLNALFFPVVVMTVRRDSASGAAPASTSVSDGASPSEEVTPSGPAVDRAAPKAAASPALHPSPTSAADAASDPDDAPMAPAESAPDLFLSPDQEAELAAPKSSPPVPPSSAWTDIVSFLDAPAAAIRTAFQSLPTTA